MITQKHKTAVTRKAHFNAAHRLHNPNWSAEKNLTVFGKCNNPNYHGHNYNIEVTVIGYCQQDTGYVIDTKILADAIEKHVLQAYDHKNLNIEVADFKALNPTTENIAFCIYNRLRPVIAEDLDLKITLFETERNYVQYPY